MNKPLVSVNITTYNRADKLVECLESVLCQTYENIEIIVVDDCSSDKTGDVMNDFISQYSNIKYIKHERNKGNAYARNTAWMHSRGYYIAFLDDDDLWIDADKLSKQVALFQKEESEKLGIICSNAVVKRNNGEYLTHSVNLKGVKKALFGGNGVIFNSSVLTKREIIEAVGGFDTYLRRGIDSDFYRQCVVVYNYGVASLPDITVEYCDVGIDRITPQNSKDKFWAVIHANAYLISKYFFYYFEYPSVLFFRLNNIYYAGKSIFIKPIR